MKYTTKVMIPKDETGDQRIIFEDEVIFKDHKIILLEKTEIKRIKKTVPSDNNMEIYTDDVCKYMKSIYKGEFVDINDKVAEFYLLCHRVSLEAKGLPEFIIINISPKTLKTLSDYIWKKTNHKEI